MIGVYHVDQSMSSSQVTTSNGPAWKIKLTQAPEYFKMNSTAGPGQVIPSTNAEYRHNEALAADSDDNEQGLRHRPIAPENASDKTISGGNTKDLRLAAYDPASNRHRCPAGRIAPPAPSRNPQLGCVRFDAGNVPNDRDEDTFEGLSLEKIWNTVNCSRFNCPQSLETHQMIPQRVFQKPPLTVMDSKRMPGRQADKVRLQSLNRRRTRSQDLLSHGCFHITSILKVYSFNHKRKARSRHGSREFLKKSVRWSRYFHVFNTPLRATQGISGSNRMGVSNWNEPRTQGMNSDELVHGKFIQIRKKGPIGGK
ncbi:hypothetical protein B0H14DRAFT_3123181 [Mycena olivaceomarginata]|nr:hypothetical protein B0H14DRAFT_3123181 [Mycena olivaceomarginata]